MKKKKHLETEFLKFLLEQQSQLQNEEEEEPIVEEPIEDDEDSDTEEEPIEDDEKIIEKLTLKYKNIEREYENQLFNRKRR